MNMHDSFLFKKIAERLFEMCKENHIYKITFLEVDVNYDSHVNQHSLLKHLIIEIPELVNYDTEIRVNQGNTDALIALVKTVEGDSDETLCD